MRLDLIALAIQEAGLGTMGTNIFVHRMDAEAVSGILLRGPLDGVTVDGNLPNYFRGSLQAIIRNPDQVTGDNIAKQLRSVIEMQRRVFLNPDNSFAMDVKQIYLAKLPIVYLRSVGHSIEWSLNFKTYYVMPE